MRRCRIGKGVFALRYFPDHCLVGEITGRTVDDRDYGSDYCYQIGPTRFLEPIQPFRFLNHSCDPNCEFDFCETRSADGRASVYVYVATLRCVYPGDQLTIDYNWSAEQAIRCRCNATNCRGWVVAPDELDRLLTAAEGRA